MTKQRSKMHQTEKSTQGSLAGMNEAGLDATEAESDMGTAIGCMWSAVNFTDMTGIWNMCNQLGSHRHVGQSFNGSIDCLDPTL